MTPGDVAIVDFQGAMGIKRRPAVVVSTTLYHSTRPDVIFGIITTQIAKATAPTDYVLRDWHAAGLRGPSAFRAYLATYSAAKVHAVIGQLSSHDWNEVQERLRMALAVR